MGGRKRFAGIQGIAGDCGVCTRNGIGDDGAGGGECDEEGDRGEMHCEIVRGLNNIAWVGIWSENGNDGAIDMGRNARVYILAFETSRVH